MTTRDKITFPENEKSKYESESDLMVAIRFSKLGTNFDIAKSLLDNYDDINKEDTEGKTLLVTSLSMNKTYIDTNIIKLIIEKGAHINKKIHPFIDYINKFESEIPNELKKKINNLINEYSDKNSPLTCAYRNYHLDILQILLEKGANINEQDKYGDTILIRILDHLNLDTITMKLFKILLEFDKNIDMINNQKVTALYIAIQYHPIEIIKLLLDKGACMYSINGSYSVFTQVIQGCFVSDWFDKAELFFERGAKIEMLPNGGVEQLSRAISEKKYKVVRLLVEHGVSVNSEIEEYKDENNKGIWTPLYFAFSKSRNDDYLEIIKIMIEKGGVIDKEIILKSIHESNTELIKIIKGSNELLSEAIKSKNINMIKLLIQKENMNDDIFFEVIKLNNMELLQLYYNCAKPLLKRDYILRKIMNDQCDLDILNFIYEKF